MNPDYRPDLQCTSCREPHIVTGQDEATRQRALDEWAGCCGVRVIVSPEAMSALHALLDEPPVIRERLAEALRKHPNPPRPDGNDRRPAAGPDTSFAPVTRSSWPWVRLPRLFSGVPAFVRRRVAAWPIDPTDLRNH